MILSAQSIRQRGIFTPFHERTVHLGRTFGLGPAGYDVRIKQGLVLPPGGFALASTVEHFDVPRDVMGMVTDKSTWARKGLQAFNTVIEPGWRGWLTLELKNQSDHEISINEGDPIVQIILHWLDCPTDAPYTGKYQDQPDRPVPAILEISPS